MRHAVACGESSLGYTSSGVNPYERALKAAGRLEKDELRRRFFDGSLIFSNVTLHFAELPIRYGQEAHISFRRQPRTDSRRGSATAISSLAQYRA